MYYIGDDDDDARYVRINSGNSNSTGKDSLSEAREWQNDGFVLRTMENNFVKNVLLIQHISHGGHTQRECVCVGILYAYESFDFMLISEKLTCKLT